MYIKAKDIKENIEKETFRFNLRNDIIDFMIKYNKNNKNNKQFDTKKLKKYIENDQISFKYDRGRN